jgi:hypothetical protein
MGSYVTPWMDELHQSSCNINLYMQSCFIQVFFLHFFARSLTSFTTVAREQVRHKLILKIKCQNFRKIITLEYKKKTLEIKEFLGIIAEIGIYRTTKF